ncbi:MAG: efflux RND transporter permease subunit [candidate division NC10 bacterium]
MAELPGVESDTRVERGGGGERRRQLEGRRYLANDLGRTAGLRPHEVHLAKALVVRMVVDVDHLSAPTVEVERRAVVVEGYFDVVMPHQVGVKNVVATLGTALTSEHVRALRRYADDVVARIKDVPGIRDATHTLAQAKPEYHIKINRDRAARFGLTVNQVETAVQTATLGQVATRYREAGEEVDIRVRFKSEFRDSIQAVASTPILTPMGTSVTLDQVAEVMAGQGPIQIARENQARRVSITANIAGRDLGGVVRDVKARIAPVEKGLPAGYFLEIGGSYEQMSEAFLILGGVFALALLLVYMVMASQFESLKHPFIIMFTIPMCLIGIVLGLLIAGRPVNLPVWIGVIILAGVAVNNAIVMIDYVRVQCWQAR